MIERAVYGTSAVSRPRRTKAELAQLHAAILTVCEDDHPLSVRGVFYRVMSAGVVEKSEKGYAAVQREVLQLRRSGDLPYQWIADGTRWHIKPTSWSSKEEALDHTAISYRQDLWHDQDVYVEIWSEKEAISSIISPITSNWDVPLMIARGFASESFLWSTANAIRSQAKPTVVYQLGDHDPSGIAAWEHVQTKLREFAPDADIEFERLAVTESQIAEHNLPTRPTKTTDSRAKHFVGESVEVDAIPTRILRRHRRDGDQVMDQSRTAAHHQDDRGRGGRRAGGDGAGVGVLTEPTEFRWRPRETVLYGQRVIVEEFNLDDDLPADLKEALGRRTLVANGGTCPCGGRARPCCTASASLSKSSTSMTTYPPISKKP
jgi:hypothetical protein